MHRLGEEKVKNYHMFSCLDDQEKVCKENRSSILNLRACASGLCAAQGAMSGR